VVRSSGEVAIPMRRLIFAASRRMAGFAIVSACAVRQMPESSAGNFRSSSSDGDYRYVLHVSGERVEIVHVSSEDPDPLA
jgi:hypothetical protein